MSTLCIVLKHSIEDNHSSQRALRFCRAALVNNQINCVFFYQQSVDHAKTQLATTALDMQRQWQVFSQQHGIPLIACHTVAERMGIEAFAEGFTDAGLTGLVSAMAKADKTIQL